MGILNKVRIGVHTQTFIVKHLAIGALASADEEDEIVLRGELGDVGHAIGHVSTDCIETLESSILGNVGLDVVDDFMELVKRLRGLRIQVDVAREV